MTSAPASAPVVTGVDFVSVPTQDFETAVAFFLAMGIAAHALDELHGRPLGTGIPKGLLIGLAVAGLAGAAAASKAPVPVGTRYH